MGKIKGLNVFRIVLMIFLFQSYSAYGDAFVEAQNAAKESRYRDVVDILTGALADPEIELEWEITAYSNRGIAYSLLDAYALADKDLLHVISLDPSHTLSLNQLGLLAERVKHDSILAARFYQRAVDLNFSGSMVNLAVLYREGRGVNQNFGKAVKLLRRAADKNYPNAYAPLGIMYARGEGIAVNDSKALEYFKKGAEYGIAEAYYRLGLFYERGRGSRVDLPKAFRNYRFAAVQGHGEAQSALGYMFKRGTGTEKNLSDAVSWYQLASDQGVASASNRFAWLLATCPRKDICNGEKAIKLALSAISTVNNSVDNKRQKDNFNQSKNALISMKDSLAAAYARNGQYELAVETMEALLYSLGVGARPAFKRRLELYKKNSPYPR